MKIILLLLGLICAVSLVSCAYSRRCPQMCQCSWVSGSLEMNCSKRNLANYPIMENLPIERLDMSYNQLTYFPKHLADISTIQYLDLSHNLITFIEADSFLGFTNLQILLLNNNSIQNWEDISPNEAFLEAINLQHLSLSANQLSIFNTERATAILNSSSILELELEYCGITSIGGKILLDGLPNLERLKLTGNKLNVIKPIPSYSLLTLHLADCDLKNLPEQLLINLPNLQFLNISWNSGLQFTDKTAAASDTLTQLDLSYCQLSAMNLNNFPSLTHLNLRANMLRSISSNFLKPNINLEVIDLSRNALANIDKDAFTSNTRLMKLDLSYNEIARLDSLIFQRNEQLSWLNLNRNVLSSFTVIHSISLRDIILSWNEIISIDKEVFSSLPALQRLDLSNNLLKNFPGGMRCLYLQKLDLSNCRLTTLRNNTFADFPQLESLRLNGNRFTNSLTAELFTRNKFLDNIWLGDNPWICDCHEESFAHFYAYLKLQPEKIRDEQSVRCASPAGFYGKTWKTACEQHWIPTEQVQNSNRSFAFTMLIIFIMFLLCANYVCLKKLYKTYKKRKNQRQYDSNMEEMNEIRRLNERILQEDSAPNAPNTMDQALPSYEAAILMPKMERPVKSMLDLTSSKRAFWTRSRNEVGAVNEEPALDMMSQRFHHSEEMLSNRSRERTAPIEAVRRTGRISHNNSGSRRFSIEDTRFASSNLKFQNLESAEKIGNFQSYENSPYSKRRPKIAHIPPFKRANFKVESVEFLTDPEFEAEASKPSSPFARRKPKRNTPAVEQNLLGPTVENYFSAELNKHNGSSDGSTFQMVTQPDIESSAGDLSAMSPNLDLSKRKKRKNSNRRISANLSGNADATESSASEQEPIVVVHKPMRETLF